MRLRFGILGIVCASFLFTQQQAEAKTITFAADSWCPVNCAPGSERPGYMVEIVEAILEPKGYDVRYVNVNWSRALLYARSGRFDAVLGALKGDAPDFVFPAEPQGETEIGIFVPKSSSWQYTSEASLKDKRIGLIRDYAYGEELERHIRLQAHPTYAGGEHPLKINMLQLKVGRIDMIVEDVGVFRHTARELGLDKEFRLAKTFSREHIYAAFSPGNPASTRLAQMLSTGMRDLRANGSLRLIMKKYALDDWRH
ncbi:substrate-binding periplasmic protein [Roseibium salinum]|uniref:Transporter substrate-binding domain-containing protein n=1 Tax=Roseibium salinum TaxID=1604349 RepID=A0ABT3R287_9HYPH|nr:transporter substrate-binding domain-containing protein [Roseibium sp. DSM 29163]MCX2723082.1 transporter substrate-binding domain-containing protein [Roseibium sp. DSM 29163]